MDSAGVDRFCGVVEALVQGLQSLSSPTFLSSPKPLQINKMSNFSTTAGPEPSQRRKTAIALVDAYNEWSLPKIMAVRSDDCIQQVLPSTLLHPLLLPFYLTTCIEVLGRPPMSNEFYVPNFTNNFAPYVRNYKFIINDLIEDEKANKVVIWGNSTSETDVGPYDNEYVLMLHFNEAGDKITRMLEFVDSNLSMVFIPKLAKHIAEQQGKKEV
jgi:hypothetical protein